MTTTTPTQGGSDTINSGNQNDLILGGAGGDVINAAAGDDVILGDHARVLFLQVDNDPSTIDVVVSTDPGEGGSDVLSGGDNNDLIFGGTAADTLHGGNHHDILLGDHGRWDRSEVAEQRFRSIFTSATNGGGNDTIHGDGGDDFILGQQGNDTLFGDAGEDDIIGGHNVTFGADGNDTIEGGADADVMVGDNARIQRTLLPGANDQWETNLPPSNTVRRDITLFDDLDEIGGNDTLSGNDGDDILVGQLGDDVLDGGLGNDELIGRSGDDNLVGGSGDDVLYASRGLVRERIDSEGVVHHDVVLEDTGTVIGVIDLTATPADDADLARKLLETDLLLLGGVQNSDGSKALDPVTGAWRTQLLLVDLTEPNNEMIDGGDGDDVIIGHRGDDMLSGSDGNDLIIGDAARYYLPFDSNIPHITNTLRLLDIADGVNTSLVLGPDGSVVAMPVTLRPEEFSYNSPYGEPAIFGNVVSSVQNEMLQMTSADTLEQSDGTRVNPFVAIVPDVVHHLDVLSGNDQLDGGAGDDFIIGDEAVVYTPLMTGLQAIDDAADRAQTGFERVMHIMRGLAIDYNRVEHDVQGKTLPHDLRFGEDTISGGVGDDTIIGDEGVIIASVQMGLPAIESRFQNAAVELHGYLADLEHLSANLAFVATTAHHQVLDQLVNHATNNPQAGSPSAPDFHDLFIGNDTITAGAGHDTVIGDHATILTTVAEGERVGLIGENLTVSDGVRSQTELALLAQQNTHSAALTDHIAQYHDYASLQLSSAELDAIPWAYQFGLTTGNDTVSGEAGDDLLIGDFSTIALPIVA
ncbi:MAG: hypothetical protein MI725_08240, partial [Pirellulales bacterium]|nr:hypothetical protein [Pirellulales bacterium]